MSVFNNTGTNLNSTNLAAAWQEIVTKVAENLTDLTGVTLTYNYSLSQERITGNFSIPAETFQDGSTPAGSFLVRPKIPSSVYEEDGTTIKSNLVGSDTGATGDIQGETILHQLIELMEIVNRAEEAEAQPVTGGVDLSYNGVTGNITGLYINPVVRSISSDGSVQISAVDYLA